MMTHEEIESPIDSSDSGSDSVCGDESSDDTDNCSHNAGPDKSEEEKELDKFTIRETERVDAWKLTTVITILFTAIVVTVGTFLLLDRSEEQHFETNFKLFAGTIADSKEFHAEELFLSLQSVSEQITKEAVERQERFPFVTLPLFEVTAAETRVIGGIESLYWAPSGVGPDTEAAWVNYTQENQNWLLQSRLLEHSKTDKTWEEMGYDDGEISTFIFDVDENEQRISPRATDGPWRPMWQMSPPPTNAQFINYNLLANSYNSGLEKAADKLLHAVIDRVRHDFTANAGLAETEVDHQKHDDFHDAISTTVQLPSQGEEKVGQTGHSSYVAPHTQIIQPIFADIFNPLESPVVGHVYALITWDRYFINLLPEGANGITAVLVNTCGQTYTYKINGNSAAYLGEGDHHEEAFDHLKLEIPFDFYDDVEAASQIDGHCVYSFHVYPSIEFESEYRTKLPAAMAAIVACTFGFLVVVFFMYDSFVHRRNDKMQNVVAKSNAIVSSLFPSSVRDRLFAAEEAEKNNNAKGFSDSGKNRLKSYLNGVGIDEEEDDDDFYKTKPIADLFTDTTVIFADLAGFTAWSSTREPSQVFILLETIYKAFDDIAAKRRVFKVETVGDCYVAVTGLPDPRKDHAVVMARFASDCMHKMHSLTKKLEIRLGPDTTDLDMRFGMHSGPVTAGVLRGERSRFQLFGDTMNTASRMESNGLKGKIQVSQETADLLTAAGKNHWLTAREDKIVAKGKGELQTYWLATVRSNNSDNTSSAGDSESGSTENYLDDDRVGADNLHVMDEKTGRLVQWNVDILSNILKKVVGQRGGSSRLPLMESSNRKVTSTVIDEISETILLPTFDANRKTIDPEDVYLGQAVLTQMKEYVSAIASMYKPNSFHSFEHASHVTMSVVKLLSRIVAPDADVVNTDSTLHDYTYGITSDPLTQFACVMSALIHDVDHPGVPNTQLIAENPQLGTFYKNKSVAEQNSVDLSWDLLQDASFADLRAAIYQTEAERKRFRQLVVNSVMATDIMDMELKVLRNARWEMAFSEQRKKETKKHATDRKATIVIEHLIQASDVAHTMQHWHIYRKWNQRLFEEMYSAYKEGRAAHDPSVGWHKGELGFFDFYIIPLTKKLKDCGVFGVSSDEYLNYAQKNRAEWASRGEECVSQMVEEVQKKYSAKSGIEGPD